MRCSCRSRPHHGFGPGADEPLFWWDLTQSPWPRALHADERGSIVAVSDGSGAPIAINSYDEYGIPGSSNQGRFQYTGQMWLPELGMYHYKNRIYSPTLGRFLQTDPIGVEGGINLYAYVGNDPVNWTDPLGLAKGAIQTDSGDIVVTATILRPFTNWMAYSSLGVTLGIITNNFVKAAKRKSGHRYVTINQVSPPACKNATSAERAAALARFSVPGRSPNRPVSNNLRTTANVGLWRNQPILVNISSNGLTIRNTTIPGHIFHDGQITRHIFQGENGALFVTTIGQGTNSSDFMAGLNQISGPGIFSLLDGGLRDYIEDSGICD